MSSKNATRFLHNPESRRAYDALQSLIKLPPHSPMRDQLWAIARAGLDDLDWDKIDMEPTASWSDDEALFASPVGGENDGDDGTLHRFFPVDP